MIAGQAEGEKGLDTSVETARKSACATELRGMPREPALGEERIHGEVDVVEGFPAKHAGRFGRITV